MQTNQCKNCQKTFKIYPEDEAFYNRVDVPEPTHCPDCRRQRRLAWRNERFLYSRKCDMCKKSIISNFSEDKPNKIYCYDCWWSDKWDPMSYGRDFDFNKKFFEQIKDLISDVPMWSATVVDCDNCDYSNHNWSCKNSYLAFDMGKCENIFYSRTMYDSRDCFDCLHCHANCEMCYECINAVTCYNCQYCYDCNSMTDCMYCLDCSGCSNCLFCFNLKNSEYCINNKQYSREEYFKEVEKYKVDRHKERTNAWKLFLKYKYKNIHRHAKKINSEGSEGNYLKNCRNCFHAFNIYDSENARYVYDGGIPGGKDFMDDDYSAWDCELSYETLGIPTPYRSKFLISCGYVSEVDYGLYGQNNKNCLGIVGVSKKQYCILNKQYTEQDYNRLRKKIIEHMKKTGEWGEFFPAKYSPFAYNESLANDMFPLKKEEIENRGWKYKEPENNQKAGYIEKNNKKCIECNKIFKLIPQELEFYKKANLPKPKKCFNCRYLDRLNLRNPAQLWHRQCMCTQPNHNHSGQCKNEFETAYSPDRKEIVYCENCYNKEVY